MADSPDLEHVQKQTLQENIVHLHGPESVSYEKDELIVLGQARNSRPYVKSFVEHYLSLGAKHIVVLDNGSTDGTVEVLKGYGSVTVLRTSLPYRTYNVAMKQYLIERFGRDRWTLLVDIDELFDYPFSDVVSLKALLRYLNEHSYTAVAAHMLDMFPEEPIRDCAPEIRDEPLKEMYRFYDLSDVYAQSYRLAEDTGNVVSNENIEILRGGIRKTLFGINATLIKHPLIFLDDEIKPMDLSDHWVGSARIADFTGVLLHYKFSDRLYEDARRSIEERNRSDNGIRRYGKYFEVLEKNPILQIKQKTSKELKTINELVGSGFVVVSRAYVRFMEGEAQKREDYSRDGQLSQAYELFFRATEEAKIRSEDAEQSQQAEQAQWANVHVQKNRTIARLKRRRVHLRKRIRSLREAVEEGNQTIARLKSRSESVESQLLDIQSSRGWKLLNMLNRLRLRVLAKKG